MIIKMTMKLCLTISLLLVSWTASAYQAIDFSPLQLQFRFEDTSAQSKETVFYQSLSAAFQKDFLRIGLGYARHNDETGNPSLHVQTEKKDYLINFGYRLFQLEGSSNNLRLDIFAEGLLGLSQTKVSTTLLGSTTSSTSNNDLIYGPGIATIGRLSYFLLESDLQLLGSNAFTPQWVPCFTIKAGVSFPLP